jgi:hypothetical protein
MRNPVGIVYMTPRVQGNFVPDGSDNLVLPRRFVSAAASSSRAKLPSMASGADARS